MGPVRHYLSYCDELRVWGERFKITDGGVPSVGETEKALWVYYEVAYGPERDRDGAVDDQRRFCEDPWVFERRTQNFLRPFLRKCKPLDQARLMAGIDPDLAGKIAGCQFEQLLKRARGPAEDSQSMRDRINEFTQKSRRGPRKAELHRIWDLRNDAIHNEGLTSGQALRMVETVERVEQAIEADRA
jgi:hypothetical protein